MPHRTNGHSTHPATLDVIAGPMFSNKSLELIGRIRRVQYAKKKTLCFLAIVALALFLSSISDGKSDRTLHNIRIRDDNYGEKLIIIYSLYYYAIFCDS